MRWNRWVAAAALLCTAGAVWASGASGDLDTAFGTGGVTETSENRLAAGAIDVTASDGSICVGGSNPTTTVFSGNVTRNWIVRRFTALGQPDTSFATDGLFTAFGDYGPDDVMDVVTDGSGRVLAAGFATFEVTSGSGKKASTSYPRRNVVLRLDSTGALDTTFGSGGIATLGIAPHQMIVLSDGRIVIAGYGASEPSATRLHPNGILDTTFGSGGVATDMRFVDTCERVMGIAAQSSGALVVGWRGAHTTRSKGVTTRTDVWHVSRFTASGAPDTSFTDTERTDHMMGGIVVGADDRIWASGSYYPDRVGRGAVVTAHDVDGAYDASFGTGGVVTAADHTFEYSVGTPVLQSDGKVVVPVHVNDGAGMHAAPLRLHADGSADTSFGPSGEGAALSLGSGQQTRTWGLGLASGGGIVMMGDFIGAPSGIYVARYVP